MYELIIEDRGKEESLGEYQIHPEPERGDEVVIDGKSYTLARRRCTADEVAWICHPLREGVVKAGVDAARRIVEKNVDSVEFFQERPYTITKVTAYINGAEYSAIGISKVQYPDRWNRELGIKIATGRAVKKIARAIASGEQLNESLS
jgi:hypothetical protein